MMSKLGDGMIDSKEQTTTTETKADIDKKPTKGISAKDIAKNPAMAKMFILAAKKFKAVQERERLEAEGKKE